MAAKHLIEGLIAVLDHIAQELYGAAGGNYEIGLFISNTVPDYDTDPADFTGANEASFAGYARQLLPDPTWGPAFQDADHSRANAITFTFTCTAAGAAQDVYGYFVARVSDGEIMFAERDPAAPVAMGAVLGATYKVTPNFALSNE